MTDPFELLQAERNKTPWATVTKTTSAFKRPPTGVDQKGRGRRRGKIQGRGTAV